MCNRCCSTWAHQLGEARPSGIPMRWKEVRGHLWLLFSVCTQGRPIRTWLWCNIILDIKTWSNKCKIPDIRHLKFICYLHIAFCTTVNSELAIVPIVTHYNHHSSSISFPHATCFTILAETPSWNVWPDLPFHYCYDQCSLDNMLCTNQKSLLFYLQLLANSIIHFLNKGIKMNPIKGRDPTNDLWPCMVTHKFVYETKPSP